MYTNKEIIKRNSHALLLILTILVIIGALFVYSSSSVFALEKYANSYYFLKKHLLGIFLGIVSIIVIQKIPLSTIKSMSPLFFIVSFGLTALTAINSFAIRIHGSSRWVKIAGLAFQPSELLKIGFILLVAFLLSKKKNNKKDLQLFLSIIVLLAASSFVLLRQPDFGLTATLATTTLILLFLAKIDFRYIASFGFAVIIAGLSLIWISPYRMQRIFSFLDPWQDPQGAGFQLIQSLIAIGSGGPLGLGIGNSKQKFFYLPMQHTDFIFSIIAEETGFLGTVALIILFLSFLYIGIRLGYYASSPFAQWTILGFIILITLQATINIAVATSLAPTKGIGLPFISYGNTALICDLGMIGLILRCARG